MAITTAAFALICFILWAVILAFPYWHYPPALHTIFSALLLPCCLLLPVIFFFGYGARSGEAQALHELVSESDIRIQALQRASSQSRGVSGPHSLTHSQGSGVPVGTAKHSSKAHGSSTESHASSSCCPDQAPGAMAGENDGQVLSTAPHESMPGHMHSSPLPGPRGIVNQKMQPSPDAHGNHRDLWFSKEQPEPFALGSTRPSPADLPPEKRSRFEGMATPHQQPAANATESSSHDQPPAAGRHHQASFNTAINASNASVQNGWLSDEHHRDPEHGLGLSQPLISSVPSYAAAGSHSPGSMSPLNSQSGGQPSQQNGRTSPDEHQASIQNKLPASVSQLSPSGEPLGDGSVELHEAGAEPIAPPRPTSPFSRLKLELLDSPQNISPEAFPAVDTFRSNGDPQPRLQSNHDEMVISRKERDSFSFPSLSDGACIPRRPAISMEATRAAAGAFGSSQLDIDHHFLQHQGPLAAPAISTRPSITAGRTSDASNSITSHSPASGALSSAKPNTANGASTPEDTAQQSSLDAHSQSLPARSMQPDCAQQVSRDDPTGGLISKHPGQADHAHTFRVSPQQQSSAQGSSNAHATYSSPSSSPSGSPSRQYGRIRSGRLGEDEGDNISSMTSSFTQRPGSPLRVMSGDQDTSLVQELGMPGTVNVGMARAGRMEG